MVRGTTIDDPLTLQEALTSSLIHRGDTLHLRGGQYAGQFTSTLVGVTVRPYGDEKPIIDGALTINGADTTWESIELMYSGWTTRRTEQTGEPDDLPLSNNLNIFGPRTTMRRCIFHDLAGPGFWTPAVDGILEECISYNNGWDAPDRGHGHGIYAQNATGTKTIRRCAFMQGYSDYSIHCYAGGGGSLQGFDVVENASLARTLIVGGNVPVDRVNLTRNILFGGSLLTGYNPLVQNGAAALKDNILANGANHETRGLWANLTEQGSDFTTGNRVLSYGGLVIVLNESRAGAVVAPKAGKYTNCQKPAESVVLEAGDLLPMTGWTAATPIAAAAPLATFDPRFAAFMVV